MTHEEKNKIFIECLKMNEEQKEAFFDSGIFNDIVEAYVKEYLQASGIEHSQEEIHSRLNSIFDIYNSKSILKKVKIKLHVR